ncbi:MULTISPECIES: cob(I)yrinic acid a,c-diamide adenosyltransferase [Methylosinus]|uniref:Corrinoid adenosyltransferase n=1 Tax=Methylosinus trichosporium (strain ATCC 35070 / NCIMB 11131 / UNIQEM 75 / OB3b) TaxID=595536 RepID=A0A2D2D3I6_METT3|nr:MULTISPECIES: cob(I)yrinic acid a,c-diamide adenosyltransferase [Methylosinus]ATQ69535.1 cob(I)yrinic acid a,c-diamide adenosyltransferase [Methylosinus trichosporium OB3b]OBS50503.1 cob(I)yrinic acid a,c-diamide adenosyltransferase [Methylosinus sp. 3S-1]
MSETDDRHSEKMRKIQAARAKIMAGKTIERGLVIVHTGAGKGKSTAAFGMVCRMIGHGRRVAIVQFIKGAMQTGEKAVFDAFPDQVEFRPMGEGFTWDTQDRARDIATATAAWHVAKARILDPEIDMVVCDELNVALRYDYAPLDDVLATLQDKPQSKHVVITGRNAPDELIARADLVTEMTLVKHPFRSGVKAQEGIEF